MADWLRELVLFTWAVVTHWQALLTGGVVMALVALYERKRKSLSWQTFIFVTLAFLLFSAFQAWQDQYQRAEGLKSTLTQKPMPDLHLAVIGFITAPAGKNNENSLVTIELRVSNLGAPSVIQNLIVQVKLADGRVVTSRSMVLPPEGGFYSYYIDGTTRPLRLYNDSFIKKKAFETPIPTNGAVEGATVERFEGVRVHEIRTHNAVLQVSCEDINGKVYTASHPFSDSNELPITDQH